MQFSKTPKSVRRMPLSRSNRIDRRRRIMLDAVAADSEFAVDSVRAKKRFRTRENTDQDDSYEIAPKYRDPGYSQAVRKTCQQRMVQLIPVRRGTLSAVLTCMWLLWGSLLCAHYFIFTPTPASTAAANTTGFSTLPIAQLFHLRSPHSIAQWLTCQLWMLTAVAAWMIFQLRRHKLDDYRARYRIWVVLAIAAALSSFEASSSALMLLGMSIDSWAKKEIGYAGFPLVLASVASVVGVFGIRLCGELKSAPMSVVSWIAGLIAWGLAALLGSGLLKLSWSPITTDLVVGGCLLGGILAVFQAAGIYLRQTYIHAQKRFLVRNGANLSPIQWKVPKLTLRRSVSVDAKDDSTMDARADSAKSKWRMPWARNRNGIHTPADRDDDKDELNKDNQQSKSTKQRESFARVPEPVVTKVVVAGVKPQQKDAAKEAPARTKGRLFGFIPSRKEQNEKLDIEPIRQDDGPLEDLGLTKKRGWFGIGGNREVEQATIVGSSVSNAKPLHAKAENRQTEQDKKAVETGEEKRSVWSRKPNAASDGSKPKAVDVAANSSKSKGWISKFSKSAQLASSKTADAEAAKNSTLPNKQIPSKDVVDSDAVDAKTKKSWFAFGSKQAKKPEVQKAVPKKSQKTAGDEPQKSARRGLFGMLDGLKLKPPTEENQKPNQPIGVKPVPIKQGQTIPSTQPEHDDDEDDDDYSGKPMSKADRKKLRRQNLDDRRAA